MAVDDLQPDSDDAALDALLARARWPELTPQSIGRLRAFWAAIPRHPASQRRWWPSVAAAAVVLIAVTAWISIRLFDSGKRRPIARRPDVTGIASTFEPVVPGRPLSPLELAMLRQWSSAPKKPTSQKIAGDGGAMLSTGRPIFPVLAALPVKPARSIVVASREPTGRAGPSSDRTVNKTGPGTARLSIAAIDALVNAGPARSSSAVFSSLADPSTAPLVSAALCKQSSLWTDALFEALDDPRQNVRIHAATVLARIDGPVVTQRLAELTRGPARREAVAALVQIQSPDAKQFIASAANSRELGGIVRSALSQYASSNQIQVR